MTCSRCSSLDAGPSTLCTDCLATDAHESAAAQGLAPTIDESAAARISGMLRPYSPARGAA